jgi:hypothetical protein
MVNLSKYSKMKKSLYKILLCYSIGSMFAILAIMISGNNSDVCDHVDSEIGSNVRNYLIGFACAYLVTFLLMMLFCICAKYVKCSQTWAELLFSATFFIHTVFTLIWFILGAIVLFRSNIDCLHQHSIYAVYALIIWCLTIVMFLKIKIFVQYVRDSGFDQEIAQRLLVIGDQV